MVSYHVVRRKLWRLRVTVLIKTFIFPDTTLILCVINNKKELYSYHDQQKR